MNTYLPRRDSLLLCLAVISKAPSPALCGDPCSRGQLRGALWHRSPGCARRTAPQTHSRALRKGTDAAWANSACAPEPRGLFVTSGGRGSKEEGGRVTSDWHRASAIAAARWSRGGGGRRFLRQVNWELSIRRRSPTRVKSSHGVGFECVRVPRIVGATWY